MFLDSLKEFLPYIWFQPNVVTLWQTMNSVRLNSLSLKYERFTLLSYKDIEIRKFKIVAKSQFLWLDLIKRKQEFTFTTLSTWIFAEAYVSLLPVVISFIQTLFLDWFPIFPSIQEEKDCLGISVSRFQALNLQNPGVETIPWELDPCTVKTKRL